MCYNLSFHILRNNVDTNYVRYKEREKKSLAGQGLLIYVITDKQDSQSKLHITWSNLVEASR